MLTVVKFTSKVLLEFYSTLELQMGYIEYIFFYSFRVVPGLQMLCIRFLKDQTEIKCRAKRCKYIGFGIKKALESMLKHQTKTCPFWKKWSCISEMCDSLEFSRLLRCLETLSLFIDAMYSNTHCSKIKINGKKLSRYQFYFLGLLGTFPPCQNKNIIGPQR